MMELYSKQFIRYYSLFCLLGLLVWAQTSPIKNTTHPSLDELLIASPECALATDMDQSILEVYCTHFGGQYWKSKDVGYPYCLANHDGKPICHFSRDTATLIWTGSGNENLEFIDIYKNKKLFHDWVANLAKNGKGLLGRSPKLGRSLITVLGKMHPFKDWLDVNTEGQFLKRHFEMFKVNGIGIGVKPKDYYGFINSVSPFKEVSAPPEFMRTPDFWKALELAYQIYSPMIDREPFDVGLLDKALLPLRAQLKKSLGDKPFLLYGIDSNTGTDKIEEKISVRIIIYFENRFFGKIWGKTIFLNLSPIDLKNKKLILQANYDLENPNPQSFLVEEYLIPSALETPRMNRIKNTQICMECHLEINKPKIGKLTSYPPENSLSYSDFKDAFILSHPYNDRAQGSAKLSIFKNSGATHFFPTELVGLDGTKLQMYQRQNLGPILGDVKSAPRSHACFSNVLPKQLAEEANCYGCHDNAKGNFGVIHYLNYEIGIAQLKRSELYESTKYISSTHKKLAQEMFMPYGFYPESSSEALTVSQLSDLIICLEEEFPKDYDTWITSRILAFLAKP